MKRECKGEENIDEEIKNNFDGLYNYFTAANIRDKVLLIIKIYLIIFQG